MGILDQNQTAKACDSFFKSYCERLGPRSKSPQLFTSLRGLKNGLATRVFSQLFLKN